MIYRWTWIRISKNSTDYYNEPDFLAGHVFWFIDNITGKYYNIKKDDTGKIVFSNDFFGDLKRDETESIFLSWIKITAPDLYKKDISIFFEPKTKKVAGLGSLTQPTEAFKITPKQPYAPKTDTINLMPVTFHKSSPKLNIRSLCDSLIANPRSFFELPEGVFSDEMATIILGKFGLSSDDALNIVKRWFESSCSTSNDEYGSLTLKSLMLLGMPVNIQPEFISGKYNKNLLERYINADEREDEDLDSLEDDFYFMMDVINLSGDKRMFHFCSENQKTSFEMVWFMVNRFSNDVEFISKIVDAYLSGDIYLEERIAMLYLMKNKGFDIKHFQAKF